MVHMRICYFLLVMACLMVSACTSAGETPNPHNDPPNLTGTGENPVPGKVSIVEQSQTDREGIKITLYRVDVSERGVVAKVTFENTSNQTVEVAKKPNIFFRTPTNLLIRATNKPLEQYEDTGLEPRIKVETDVLFDVPVGSWLVPEEIKEMTVVFGNSAKFKVLLD